MKSVQPCTYSRECARTAVAIDATTSIAMCNGCLQASRLHVNAFTSPTAVLPQPKTQSPAVVIVPVAESSSPPVQPPRKKKASGTVSSVRRSPPPAPQNPVIPEPIPLVLTPSTDVAERIDPLKNGAWDMEGREELFQRFLDQGGTFFDTSPLLADAYPVPFRLLPTDWVAPVCHQGQCRSQALYRLLQENMSKWHPDDVDAWVSPPHGATSGCDPFAPFGEQVTEDNYWQYTYDSFACVEPGYDYAKARFDEPDEQKATAYMTVFGQSCCPRVGEKTAAKHMPLNLAEKVTVTQIASKRVIMRTWFDNHYYNVGWLNKLPEGVQRRVFFTFCRAGSVIPARLAENGPSACKNTVVVAIDMMDHVTQELRNKSGSCKTTTEKVAVAEEGWRMQLRECSKLYTGFDD